MYLELEIGIFTAVINIIMKIENQLTCPLTIWWSDKNCTTLKTSKLQPHIRTWMDYTNNIKGETPDSKQ